MYNNSVFILDFDGVMTSGHMWYNKDGKYLKCLGCDDADILKELNKYIHIHFITADKKGYPITKKRIEQECGYELDIVSNYPKERWEWIKNKYENKKIYFMGDGWGDFLSLKNSYAGITTRGALQHTKQYADYITTHPGGDRAVADACLWIFEDLGIKWNWGIND